MECYPLHLPYQSPQDLHGCIVRCDIAREKEAVGRLVELQLIPQADNEKGRVVNVHCRKGIDGEKPLTGETDEGDTLVMEIGKTAFAFRILIVSMEEP